MGSITIKIARQVPCVGNNQHINEKRRECYWWGLWGTVYQQRLAALSRTDLCAPVPAEGTTGRARGAGEKKILEL
jgi:hypothetical protein